MYTLKLSNFGIHRDLSVNIRPGITLIKGPNGSGKSTILDSIYANLVEVSTASKASLIRKYSGTPKSCVLQVSLIEETTGLSRTVQSKLTVSKVGKLTVGRGSWSDGGIDIGNNHLCNSMYLRQFSLADVSMLSDYFRTLVVGSEAYEQNKISLDTMISEYGSKLRAQKALLERYEADIADTQDVHPGLAGMTKEDLDNALANRIELDRLRIVEEKQRNTYEVFLSDQRIRDAINELPGPISASLESELRQLLTLKPQPVPMPTKPMPSAWSTASIPRVIKPSVFSFTKEDLDKERIWRSYDKATKCPCCGRPGTILADRVIHHDNINTDMLDKERPLKTTNLEQLAALQSNLKKYNIKNMREFEDTWKTVDENTAWKTYQDSMKRLAKAPPEFKDAELYLSACNERRNLQRLIRMPSVTHMEPPSTSCLDETAPTVNDINIAHKHLRVLQAYQDYTAIANAIANLNELRAKSESSASVCMRIIMDIYNERLSMIMAGFHVPLRVHIDMADDGSYDIVDSVTGGSWRNLSGGQQMMVSLALTIALARDTAFPFILIDESLSCIAENIKEHIIQTMRDYCPSKYILVVDHDGLEGMYDETIVLS